MPALASLACGFVFGWGLLISGMMQPAKVLGFLDVLGPWDPTLLEECRRLLAPGGRLWLFALNPLAPYRWNWRGTGLGGTEPATWRRRLRRAGFAPEALSQGIGPRWNPQVDDALQSGAGIRAAYVLRAEKRAAGLTPVRSPREQPLRTLAAPA